jgi:hypothetical protein
MLIVAACSQAPAVGPSMPEGHPLEQAIVAVDDEIDVHRENVAAATSIETLGAEVARHKASAAPLYRELGSRVVEMHECAAPGVGDELAGLMRGIEATERGRDEGMRRNQTVVAARAMVETYAAGIEDSVARIGALAAAQAGCF